jgi:hypothetical protein
MVRSRSRSRSRSLAIISLPTLAVVVLAAAATAAARPSFFSSNGWTLVDDEPDLRIETTVHGWGDNVSVDKREWYDDDAFLHGSASGSESDVDVQLEYELVDGTWVATVDSSGRTADGKIRHQNGISKNELSGSAASTGSTPARVSLNSGIDDCDPSSDDNCFSGVSLIVEGDEVSSDFDMTQVATAGGETATTLATGHGSGAGAGSRIEGGSVSVISFFPWLQAAVNAMLQGTDGVTTDVDSSATVVPTP